MTKPAAVVCTKCGGGSAAPTPQCSSCGASNILVCGECGFQNSLSKKYCDKCGTPSFLTPSGLPAPFSSSPDEPDSFDNAVISGDPWSKQEPTPEVIEPPPPPPNTRLRLMIKTALSTLGAILSLLTFWYWTEYRQPSVQVKKTATHYLESLRTGNWESAYQLFTDTAKKNCSLKEFIASRDDVAWTWSNLEIIYSDSSAIVLSYDLGVKGSPPRPDYLLFVLEKYRWLRPFNSVLVRKAEQAFAAGNSELALDLTKAAAAVDPRDDLARGRLCEAAYLRRDSKDAVVQCEAAVELSRLYPFKLPSENRYRIHGILVDTYKNTLKTPDKALEHYSQILAFPNAPSSDQCQILLGRAETYIAISRPGEALADIKRATRLCDLPDALSRIEDMRRLLNAPPDE